MLRRRFLETAIGAFAPQEARFSGGVKVVTLFASVRDRHGRLVTDLPREDFQLSEDGQRQEIRYFSRETDLPLKLGILIDTSASQYGILESERRASYTFLDRVLRPADLAFIAKFDIQVAILQPLTSSRQDLQNALQAADLPKPIRPAAEPERRLIPRGTKLFASFRQTTDDPRRAQPGRKAIILLTDGVDAGSTTRLDAAIRHAQRADAAAYSILYADPTGYKGQPRENGTGLALAVATRGRPALQRLSRETGGGYYEVSRRQSIEAIYDRIQEELRNQYSIAYTPTRSELDGRYRKIRLAVRGSGLTVQARDGYFAL